MKIGIAGDHAGFELKKALVKQLTEAGHEVIDYGPHSYDPDDDYPDCVLPLANAVAEKQLDKAIAVCGSGVGVSVTANKVTGVRAALITENYSAHQGVEHDDMNMLCLGARVIGPALIKEIVDTYLQARYKGGIRFKRRLDKIIAIENNTYNEKST